MTKEFFVAFADSKLKENFELLKTGKYEDQELCLKIEKAIGYLKTNPQAGTKIPQKQWPRYYTKNYAITNLWKYNLSDAWRLIYTIESDEIRIMSIILEWLNHKGYNRRFNY